MPAPTFYTPLNNASTTINASHTAGGGTITVASGSIFGSPSSSNPVRVSVQRASDNAIVIYSCTGVSTNVLTVTPIEGTSDLNLVTGDTVEVRMTAGALTDIQTWITNFGAGTAGTSGTAKSVLYLNASSQVSQDSSNFVWDGTSHNLGLGLSSPTYGFHQLGGGQRLQGLGTPSTPTITTGTSGTTYYYWVVAVDRNGFMSLPSSSVGLTANTGITITWTAVTGAVSYKVFRNTTNTLTANTLVGSPSTNSFTDSANSTSSQALPTHDATADLKTDGWISMGDTATPPTVPIDIIIGSTSIATNIVSVSLSGTQTTSVACYYCRNVSNAGSSGSHGYYAVLNMSSSGNLYGANLSVGGFAATGTCYGLYTNAFGNALNYGIYATASQGTTNWAGWFQGNVNVQGSLYVNGSPFSGSSSTTISTISANTTLSTQNYVLASGAITLTLPTAASSTQVFTIKNISSSSVTINTTSAQLIDGSTTLVLSSIYAAVTLVPDGTSAWYIV